MSLGLFNCRLIQPAGDQLFFFSAVLPLPVPVRASSVQSPCDPSCSAPTNGRAQNASCLSFSERFCFGFQRGEVPSGAEGFTPNDSPANFPEDPPILPTDSATDPLLTRVQHPRIPLSTSTRPAGQAEAGSSISIRRAMLPIRTRPAG